MPQYCAILYKQSGHFLFALDYWLMALAGCGPPSPFSFTKGFEEPVTCPPDYVPQWMGNYHAEMGGKFCYLYMETTAKVNNPHFSNNHI